MYKLKLLTAFLVMMVANSLSAQRFQSLNDEFPFGRARCAIQDSYGFLWFGTVDGLVKYDGVSIRTFRNSPNIPNSLPGQEILAIIEFTDTTLLLGFQDEGLVEFNRNSGATELIELSGTDERLSVYSMVKSRDSTVWIGTDKGLFSFKHNEVQNYRADPSDPRALQSQTILKVYEDTNLDIWAGTRRGMHRLDRVTGQFDTPKSNPSFPNLIIIDIKDL